MSNFNKSFTRSDTMNSAFHGEDFTEKEQLDLYFEIEQKGSNQNKPLILKRVDQNSKNLETEVYRSEPTPSKDYKFNKSFLTDFYFEKK